MFFHHPEPESSLRRMATTALHGSPMEPSDLRTWPRIKKFLKTVFWEVVLTFAFCLLAGLNTPQLRNEPAWRNFMLAGGVMLTSRLSSQLLFWLLQSSPTVNALWHLPVTGQDICRWVRRTHLLGALKQLPRMTVVAWAWLGFPALEAAWMQILWSGVVLWLIMLACVQYYSLSRGAGRWLGKIWNLTMVAWICMALYAWWGSKNAAPETPLPEWVLQLCAPASWMLPAQWAMQASENPTALVFALVCLAGGAILWWRFPASLAITYDRLVNVPAPEADSSEKIEEAKLASLEPATLGPGQVMMLIQEAEADAAFLAREGWIEKLLLLLLHKRDRVLGPILIGLQAGWTVRWWKAVRLCTLLLLTSYALLNFGTSWIKEGTLEFWTAVLMLIVVVNFTFPASNSIPLATLSWPLGQHGMPFFAGLPISMRDLLRVSIRITAARMIACLALALPVIAALCLLMNHTKAMPVMLGMAVIFSVSWVLVRPAFIYFRLQGMSRPGNGHRLGHAFTYLLIAPLALGIPFSVVFSVTIFQASLAWLAVSLPFTACCARGIYAVLHWRVSTRKVDWINDGVGEA